MSDDDDDDGAGYVGAPKIYARGGASDDEGGESEGEGEGEGESEGEGEGEGESEGEDRKNVAASERDNESEGGSEKCTESAPKQTRQAPDVEDMDRPQMTKEEIVNAKRDLLYRFDRIEKKGIRIPRRYSMASDLGEMQAEYDRLVKDRNADAGIKFQKQVLVAVVSGIEFVNRRYDPFDVHLDGWSETVNENLEDYDDVLEELHTKYRGKAKMAPELKLMMMLVGSAVMFHMTNTMFKSAPALGQVVKDNPELMKQFAAATANTMRKEAGGGSGSSGGLAGLLGGLFGGGGPPPPAQHRDVPYPTPEPIRGPSSSRIAEVQRFMQQQQQQQQQGGVPNPSVRPPLPRTGRESVNVKEQPLPPRQAQVKSADARGAVESADDADLVDIMSAASSDITVGGTRSKKRVTLKL